MITRAEVKAALLSVEKANGPIAFLDHHEAKVTRDELRILIEAAKRAQYQARIASGTWQSPQADSEYFL